MFLAIGGFLSIFAVVSSSPLHDAAVGSVHRLQKRDWVRDAV